MIGLKFLSLSPIKSVTFFGTPGGIHFELEILCSLVIFCQFTTMNDFSQLLMNIKITQFFTVLFLLLWFFLHSLYLLAC